MKGTPLKIAQRILQIPEQAAPRRRSGAIGVHVAYCLTNGRGYTLTETLMALVLFALILVTCFLPFKLTTAATAKGGFRMDTASTTLIAVNRIARDLAQGTNVTFASPLPSCSPAAYSSCSFQPLFYQGNQNWVSCTSLPATLSSTTVTCTYYSQAVPNTGNTEYRVYKSMYKGGTMSSYTGSIAGATLQAGYPQLQIPDPTSSQKGLGGVTTFFFQPTRCPINPSDEYALVLLVIKAFPADAARPLPCPVEGPIQVATGFTIRNGLSDNRPSPLNPYLYP